MSKKFKNKTCVYCTENLSSIGDHIFAREFFLKKQRANLPKVPSCQKCNNEKSKLEHYLTTLLPFGGRHDDAKKNLKRMVPKRLKKNAKLHRNLSAKMNSVWAQEDSGIYAKQRFFEIEKTAITELFEYIVRGLYWLHCNTILEKDAYIKVLALSKYGEEYFDTNFISIKEFDHYSENYGSGTISYEGVKDPTNSMLSWWVFSIYGGLQLIDSSKTQGDISEKIGVFTVPERMASELMSDLRSAVNKQPIDFM
jgi:hypothetical protein